MVLSYFYSVFSFSLLFCWYTYSEKITYLAKEENLIERNMKNNGKNVLLVLFSMRETTVEGLCFCEMREFELHPLAANSCIFLWDKNLFYY